jgi:hypothetical protein
MRIVHATQAPIAAPGLSTADWNKAHLVSFVGVAYSASGTLPAPPNLPDIVEATGGSGGITLTLPSAAANPGALVIVKKVDSGAGAVTLQDAASANIDGQSTYVLANQFQYVWLYASVVTGTWGVMAQGGD